MERSSSFARSFFQAGAGGGGNENPYGYENTAGGANAPGGDMFGGQTMGTPRAQRRRSSRRRSRSGFGGTPDSNMLQNAAAAAAAAMAGIDDNEPSKMAAGGGMMGGPGGPAGGSAGMGMGPGGGGGAVGAVGGPGVPGGMGMPGGVGGMGMPGGAGGGPGGMMMGQPNNAGGGAAPAGRASGSRGQQRQPSWYQEALLQGGAAEDLNAFLGEASNLTDHNVDDDEVLEQYRIMAHMEANKQVKENIGFDLAEYEEKRQMHPDNSSRGDYAKKPKPIFPEPRQLAPSGGAIGGIGGMQAEEPALPPPRVNRRFVDQRSLRVPELCPGTVVRGSSTASPGQVLVRCLGCRVQLSVKLLSTLASCPECNTVSPATTTRH